ncbi:hypothetical protein [Bosea sp. (in: a-proteobacteria)]|uniref:hypothetical protein n=1 Tax=Bosea sp. (in: a-proteobacteria) TaxID=1871050 RepID=UPI0031FE8330
MNDHTTTGRNGQSRQCPSVQDNIEVDPPCPVPTIEVDIAGIRGRPEIHGRPGQETVKVDIHRVSGDSRYTTDRSCIRDDAAAKAEIVERADVARCSNESHSVVREWIISRHFGESTDIANCLRKRSLASKVLERYKQSSQKQCCAEIRAVRFNQMSAVANIRPDAS